MSFTYSHSLRLNTKTKINQAFQQAKKISAKKFSLFVKDNQQEQPRLGTIVAKRAVALAVGRNRIKRVVREWFRLQQHKLPHKDIMFVAYNGIDKLNNLELKQWLEKSLLRVK